MSPAPKRPRTVRSNGLTISQIINRMQDLADEQYHGDLLGNALVVFNQLTAVDKKTFVQKSLLTLWEKQIEDATGGEMPVVLDQQTKIDRRAVREERRDITQPDPQEKAKLRNWLWRMLMIVGFFSFVMAIVISTLYGNSNGLKDLLEHGKLILELLF